MDKPIDFWKLVLGGAVVPTAYAFFKKAIPVWQCAAEKCLEPSDRWAAVLAMLIAVGMVIVALWMRGSAAEKKATVALREAQSLREDVLTVLTAFDIRTRGGEVHVGPTAAHLFVQDAHVEKALRRLRGAAK